MYYLELMFLFSSLLDRFLLFLFSSLSGPEEIHAAQKQWDWLESTLKESTADYLLVGGHYPVWSISNHGPTECLVDQLQHMLQKYQATSYICGHDHNLQVRLMDFSSRGGLTQFLEHFTVISCASKDSTLGCQVSSGFTLNRGAL